MLCCLDNYEVWTCQIWSSIHIKYVWDMIRTIIVWYVLNTDVVCPTCGQCKTSTSDMQCKTSGSGLLLICDQFEMHHDMAFHIILYFIISHIKFLGTVCFYEAWHVKSIFIFVLDTYHIDLYTTCAWYISDMDLVCPTRGLCKMSMSTRRLRRAFVFDSWSTRNVWQHSIPYYFIFYIIAYKIF